MKLRYNFLSNTLGGALGGTISDTAITFNSALTEYGVNIPTIAVDDYIVLICEDEVMYLTAYTSGATTGTVSRGEEGSAIAAHADGAFIFNGPTTEDFFEYDPTTNFSIISPSSLTVAQNVTSTLHTLNLNVVAPSLITLSATSIAYGNSGSGSAAGFLEWYDDDISTVISVTRWHNNGTERQMLVPVNALSCKVEAGVYTFLLRATNDSGSSQTINYRENRITYNIVVIGSQ